METNRTARPSDCLHRMAREAAANPYVAEEVDALDSGLVEKGASLIRIGEWLAYDYHTA